MLKKRTKIEKIQNIPQKGASMSRNLFLAVAFLYSLPLLSLPREFQMQSIIGTNNLQEISTVTGTDLYDTASGIVRMESKNNTFSCTAFRVGPQLFMTNFHCTEIEPCEKIRFRSYYEKGMPATKQKFYQCAKLLTAIKKYDLAVYSVQETIDDIPMVILTDRSLNTQAPLFLASHPGGMVKKIDKSDDCKLQIVEEFNKYERVNITHSCDTMGGSSGSPVFDLGSRHVVALHWGGNSNQVGKFNHAIPMKRVLEHLKAEVPAVYEQLQVVH